MPTEVINFRLAKQPLIKEKIIVLEEADGRKAVIFPMYREKHDIAHAEIAKEGEVLELTGKWGTDKKTGKPQFYVDKAYNAQISKEVNNLNVNTGKVYGKYDINPAVDFTVGGKSNFNNKLITMSEPKEGRKQYYTDGDYYWYEGDTKKCPTIF